MSESNKDKVVVKKGGELRAFDYFANAIKEIRRSSASESEFKELPPEVPSSIPQEIIDYMEAHCFPAPDYHCLEVIDKAKSKNTKSWSNNSNSYY